MDYLEQVVDENGTLKTKLKETHPYYTQTQLQMFVTRAEACHFFVYSAVDYKHVEVIYDENFC